ncbi:hypothetical protein QJS04_geneDACA018064 [Acorus gramineus]|uniref:Aminotransferase-like plant mobile domain-containing protein n=1 Tax=Acorus gramineus TaxID=55184 RepID=A0AAV9A920_ACOGR|nr:hypothetical protein QJS04_geneDACA018064 [Acorus gramineus]
MAEEQYLVTERVSTMVTSTGDQPVLRLARFLRPRVTQSFAAAAIPQTPLICEALSLDLIKWSDQFSFGGWRRPSKGWADWVEKLRSKYGPTWAEAGVYEAIISSKVEVKKDKEAINGVLKFWCEGTNTFAFAWGEATVTLEDARVLGGFSVEGEHVRGGLEDARDREVCTWLVGVHAGFYKSSSRKASYSAWVRQFSGGCADEAEHVAFLAMWLSRYVFPSHPSDAVGRHVIPIAVRLARGTRLALAPAVVGSLYRDMRTIKKRVLLEQEEKMFIAYAPFQLLQLWLWERFHSLRPRNSPNQVCEPNEPRATWWSNLPPKSHGGWVDTLLNMPGSFNWRPYRVESPIEADASFSRCVRPCELVGLDCIEQYLPHRVARQFGFDQCLPAQVPRANADWESAWASYDVEVTARESARARSLARGPFETGMSAEYHGWWGRTLARREARLRKMSKSEMRECLTGEKAWWIDELPECSHNGGDAASFALHKVVPVKEEHV